MLQRNTPLNYGEEVALQLTSKPLPAGTFTYRKTIGTTAALVSLFVEQVSGTLTVNLYNNSEDGKEELKATFPLISAATPAILVERINDISSHVRVEVISTGGASIDLKIKAAESLGSSGSGGDVNLNDGDGNSITSTECAPDKRGLDVVRLNSIFSKPYDDLQITTLTVNGEPQVIESYKGAVLQETITITYNGNEDIVRVQRS